MADRGVVDRPGPGAGTDIERLKQQHPEATSTVRQVVKATTAVTLGGSLLTLSGLLLVGTVISLAIATPLLVLFSPVLVPAVITVGLIFTGFLTSGGFGVAAVTAFTFMYKSVMGQQPSQGLAARAQHMPQQLASKARDAVEQLGQQTGAARS